MSKALVLGAAALLLSAASASAQVYATPDYGYEPVADLAVPADGYAAPAAPPAYAAPPVYAAPAPPVYVVPAPVYVAPLVPRYYAAPVVLPPPVVSRPIYAYAPGYWGGYGHGSVTVTGGDGRVGAEATTAGNTFRPRLAHLQH
jgi:hypothetical protein